MNIQGEATREKVSWETAFEYWWSFAWRFAVIEFLIIYPLGGLIGGIMALNGLMEYTEEVGRVIGYVSVFVASLIAMKWMLNAYRKHTTISNSSS